MLQARLEHDVSLPYVISYRLQVGAFSNPQTRDVIFLFALRQMNCVRGGCPSLTLDPAAK